MLREGGSAAAAAAAEKDGAVAAHPASAATAPDISISSSGRRSNDAVSSSSSNGPSSSSSSRSSAEQEEASGGPRPFSPFLPQSPLNSLLQSHAARMQPPSGALHAFDDGQTAAAHRAPLGLSATAGGRSQGRFRELSAADKPRANTLRPISPEELAQHTARSDCWVALEGVVYDISNYLRFHPGGSSILLSVAGREAGIEFRRHHPWVNYGFILENCRVGILKNTPGAAHTPQTLAPPTPYPLPNNAFPVPSGKPEKKIRDPLRLALRNTEKIRECEEEDRGDLMCILNCQAVSNAFLH
ncbi:hypothetical protein Efla_002314 [Eimeria flavescens]